MWRLLQRLRSRVLTTRPRRRRWTHRRQNPPLHRIRPRNPHCHARAAFPRPRRPRPGVSRSPAAFVRASRVLAAPPTVRAVNCLILPLAPGARGRGVVIGRLENENRGPGTSQPDPRRLPGEVRPESPGLLIVTGQRGGVKRLRLPPVPKAGGCRLVRANDLAHSSIPTGELGISPSHL
jgi:hypothetical protein